MIAPLISESSMRLELNGREDGGNAARSGSAPRRACDIVLRRGARAGRYSRLRGQAEHEVTGTEMPRGSS